MKVEAKICGLKDPENLRAAVDGSAAFIGLVFYERSPRHISVAEAAGLAEMVRGQTKIVALLVDADDAAITQIVETVQPDMLQLHGQETVVRVAAIRQKFGLPVMKAVSIGDPQDIEIAKQFDTIADWLLFDAKPTTSSDADLPGGNGIAFDWRLLQGQQWTHPWMLSGGLVADTVCDAARLTGAHFVDVSSGVESTRGQKDPGLIKEFLRRVAACEVTAQES